MTLASMASNTGPSRWRCGVTPLFTPYSVFQCPTGSTSTSTRTILRFPSRYCPGSHGCSGLAGETGYTTACASLSHAYTLLEYPPTPTSAHQPASIAGSERKAIPMPPEQDTQKPSSRMPPDAFALIEWIDKVYPVRVPTDEEWATAAGRLGYARYAGKRELIDRLKDDMQNEIARKKEEGG